MAFSFLGTVTSTVDPAQKRLRLFEDALEKFGFHCFFPGKLGLQNVMKITKDTVNETKLMQFIKRLIMLDHRARDNFNTAECKAPQYDTLNSAHSEINDDFDSLLELDDIVIDESPHPLDYFLLAFLCCDRNLRQTFVQKLFLCRLAIPLLYPTFIGDTLELLLWPLRSIILEWKRTNEELVELDAASSPTNFVSFCRVGKSDRYKKSKIANDMISDGQHDTFFHADCPNGTVSRNISEGVVEGSWYIPSGRESDLCDNLTMFLNLRGDSLDYSRQVHFISLVSTVIVLLVDVERISEDDTCNLIASLQSYAAKLVVLLYVSTKSVNMNVVKRHLAEFQRKNLSGKPKIISTFAKQNHKGTTDIKNDLRKHINQLCRQSEPQSLSEVVKGMNIDYITCDESQLHVKSKDTAQTVMKHINLSANATKEQIPLQGKELWQKWSTLLKKKCRPSTGADKQESTVQMKEKLQEKMDTIRKEQLKGCLNPSKFMNAFVTELIKCSEADDQQQIVLFLQWLGLQFDQHSRSILPEFRSNYQNSWSSWQKLKGSKSTDDPEVLSLQKEVSEAEDRLINAPLGLEHLMRELGQMFEAVEGCDSSLLNHHFVQNIRKLPKIVASLLLNGQPFELMDGDAGNIPLSWLKAVLSELKLLLSEKKTFVVSILGVQSSGKSTLLNTMFGLQFGVSAGRCTKGVCMQLVQCETGLPFDYVYVVDTEGLRAPELSMQKYDHDNEITTLVIGLGDLTIVNIKGENYTEVKDSIQIAVHAFLRMKLVSNYENHYRCIFVHQNVPAANAQERLKTGCLKLQENLDEMTVEAAAQENFANIRTFDQIIAFNCHEDVWFFPDLLHGDPPMAPANPGYSTSVKEIRDKIFSEMAKQKTGFLFCDDFNQRIKDLWQGILADDFVFSFRNSLEMKAYTGLERKYQQLILQLEEGIMQWEIDTAEVRIGACDSQEKINQCEHDLQHELHKCVDTLDKDLQEALTNFFENDSYTSIIIQWKQNKINSLQYECQNQRFSTSNDINEQLRAKEMEIMKDKDDDKYKLDIMKQAYQLSQSVKMSTISENELRAKFEDLWKRWVRSMSAQTPSSISRETIKAEMEKAIYDRLSAHKSSVTNELSADWTAVQLPDGNLDLLIDSINEDTVAADNFSVEIYFGSFKSKDTDKNKMKELKIKHLPEALQHIKKTVLQDIQLFLLQQQESKAAKFKQSTVTKLINMVLNKMQGQKLDFKEHHFQLTFLPPLLAKLVVHTFKFAYPIICTLHENYEDQHGYLGKMKSYRETLWTLFKNNCNDRKDEIIAADFFLGHLKDKIKQQALDAISKKAKMEIRRMYETKQFLMQTLMADLADKDNFEDYLSYISCPEEFAAKWLERIGNKYFEEGRGTDRKLSMIPDEVTTQICLNIGRCFTSIEHTERSVSMVEWINMFCEKSEEAKFAAAPSHYPVEQIQISRGRTLHVKDLNHFSQLLQKGLGQIKDDLHEVFRNIPLKEVGIDWSVYEEVVNKLWGCRALCPFVRNHVTTLMPVMKL